VRRFVALYEALDASASTDEKVRAMAEYFATSPSADAAVALHTLCGGRLHRAMPARELRSLAAQVAGLPPWLVDACHAQVGDLSETLSLLLPAPEREGGLDEPLANVYAHRVQPLASADAPGRARIIADAWSAMDARQRLVYHKLIRGGLRVGVQRRLVARALARAFDLPTPEVVRRMARGITPDAHSFAHLTGPAHADDLTGPAPFYLAHQLDASPQDLGPPCHWLAEWKYDGVRAQLVVDRLGVRLWSRGEEDIGPRFPEILRAAGTLPEGVVLDGEVVGWEGDRPASFGFLQRRLNTLPRTAAQGQLFERRRFVYLAFDLPIGPGGDLRDRPLRERRAALHALLTHADDPLRAADPIEFHSWELLAELRQTSRRRNVEGIVLKHLDGPYGDGRTRHPQGKHWWKWKLDPRSLDAVLIMAQLGSGRRAGLHTDYTLALWDRAQDTPALVSFAKAYGGLTQDEIERVDAFVRANTVGRSGPVRRVAPQLVFEIGFEGVRTSSRHKAGLAVRFPRILRWRHDKTPEQADDIRALRAMLPEEDPPPPTPGS